MTSNVTPIENARAPRKPRTRKPRVHQLAEAIEELMDARALAMALQYMLDAESGSWADGGTLRQIRDKLDSVQHALERIGADLKGKPLEVQS